MFARLILSLLLAAFALPAMAVMPCHDDSAPAMVMAMPASGHHSAPVAPATPDDRTMVHACIGCIPPSTLRAGSPVDPLATTLEIRVARVESFDPGKARAPDTPPPRAEA